MIGCVYNTDSEWFNYLNDHNIVDEVNFWRKDKRKLNLPQGSFFFFKLRGTRKIVGRARFQEIKLMSVTEAWQTFGTKNGVAGKSIFENKIVEVLDINTVSENTEINCIILSDLEFLSENQIFEIDQQMFPPSILASKFFKGQDLEWLNSHFINVKKINEVTSDELQHESDKKLVLHSKIERNRKIVDELKRNSEWKCEICGIVFIERYGFKYIEAHHKVPLCLSGKTVNSVNDLSLLCPNCHKAIHIAMVDSPGSSYDLICEKIQSLDSSI